MSLGDVNEPGIAKLYYVSGTTLVKVHIKMTMGVTLILSHCFLVCMDLGLDMLF